MSQRRTLILVAAIAIGALASFLVWNYVNGVKDDAYGSAQRVKVYLVKQSIPKNTYGQEAEPYIAQDEIPSKFLPPNAVQNLDDTWVNDYFPDAGGDSVLYKAEADGEWSWQGEDADYSASFDIEAGADNYQPLIDLLDLVNNGSAEEIASELPGMVDIDSFATYLAFEEVIDNFDDIDGPGNNAYLFWDSSTGRFTVVAWDHNLAFGGSPTGGGPGGQRPDGEQGERIGDPDQAPPFGGGAGAQNAGGPGGMTRDNPLVSAFTANSEWLALYESRVTELESSLIDSGTLEASVDEWENTLTAGASDLVADETITTEGEVIDVPETATASLPAPANSDEPEETRHAAE